MEDTRTTEGGCLCGAVRFRAEGPGWNETICHCATCRKAAGAPVVAWVTFDAARFAWTGEEPVRHRSSADVVRTFCGRCGTSLTYARDGIPGEIDVTTCSLDEPLAFAPKDQTWTSARIPWMQGADALPGYARTREDGERGD